MKRKLIISAIVIGLFSAIAFVVPILIIASKSRPLYGNFDMGTKCMGGHEIFLFLGEVQAFEHCPGHRDMKVMGKIERSESSVTVYGERGDTPWCRIDLEGSGHTTLVFLNDSSRHDLPQVNNPWRTWLPRFLPEE